MLYSKDTPQQYAGPRKGTLPANWMRSARSWLTKVEQALARYEHVPPRSVNLFLSDEQMFQLLNWKTWSLRYEVSVDFILTTLLDYYQKIRQLRRHHAVTLGVGVAQLTGPRAQEIIEQQAAASFPDGENHAAARGELRSRMLGVRLEEFPIGLTLAESLERYRQKIERQQQRGLTLPKNFFRPWRGNPFR